jgi:hypothetical protein
MSSELSLAKTSDASSRIPDDKTLRELFKISLVEDKDIKSDYWRGSLDKSILIGVGKTSDGKDEKILVRSEEEYTSPINKVIKVNKEFIVVTENSLYVVDSEIPIKRIDKSM